MNTQKQILPNLCALLIVACSLLFVSCEQPSGVQPPEGRFSSLNDMAACLASQPENTPDTSWPVALSGVNLSGGLNPLFAALQGRYVNLEDLGACVLRDIPPERDIQARENSDRLASLTLPQGLLSIGGYAFYQSSSLAALVLPDSLRSIGDSAFKGCALAELALPSRLQSLGGSAFANSAGLRSLAIPASLSALTATLQDHGPVSLSAGESRILDLPFQRRFWKLTAGSHHAETGPRTLTFTD